MQRGDADMALISKAFPVFNLMKKTPGWVLVYDDAMCALFVRAGTPALEQLRATRLPEVPWEGQGMSFP